MAAIVLNILCWILMIWTGRIYHIWKRLKLTMLFCIQPPPEPAVPQPSPSVPRQLWLPVDHHRQPGPAQRRDHRVLCPEWPQLLIRLPAHLRPNQEVQKSKTLWQWSEFKERCWRLIINQFNLFSGAWKLQFQIIEVKTGVEIQDWLLHQ